MADQKEQTKKQNPANARKEPEELLAELKTAINERITSGMQTYEVRDLQERLHKLVTALEEALD